tara:strand:+ start:234 stop:479 length:246 start_codon:yes stop_codon:yes gene_type:complete
MIAKNKLETLEEICLSITKDDTGAYTFPSDEMMDHILSLMEDNYAKIELIGKIFKTIKNTDDNELIHISNTVSDLTDGFFD